MPSTGAAGYVCFEFNVFCGRPVTAVVRWDGCAWRWVRGRVLVLVVLAR